MANILKNSKLKIPNEFIEFLTGLEIIEQMIYEFSDEQFKFFKETIVLKNNELSKFISFIEKIRYEVKTENYTKGIEADEHTNSN